MSYPPSAGYPGFNVPPAKKPGKVLFILTGVFAVLMLGCFVGGGIALAKGTLGKVDGFGRVPVGSSGTITLGTGDYLAYYEASDVSSSISTVPTPIITLTDPSGGTRTLNTLYGGEPRSNGNIKTKLTYSKGSHHGIAIYQFSTTKKGTYQVTVDPSSVASNNSDIAFGRSIGSGLAFGGVLIGLGFLFLVVAVILMIIAIVRRVNFGRRSAAFAGPPGYGGPPPPGYGQGGYQQGGYPQPGQYPQQGGYPQQSQSPQQGGYPQQGQYPQQSPPPGWTGEENR